MSDRSGICGNRRVEDTFFFHLKNFSSFFWRWIVVMVTLSTILGVLDIRFLLMSAAGSIIFVSYTGFIAWIWAWGVVVKRWHDRVMVEAIDVEVDEGDELRLPVCPSCKEDLDPPMLIDTPSQCPHCNALLYPLVYRPTCLR